MRGSQCRSLYAGIATVILHLSARLAIIAASRVWSNAPNIIDGRLIPMTFFRDATKSRRRKLQCRPANVVLSLLMLALSWAANELRPDEPPKVAPSTSDDTSIFRRDNLIAWCIVPFDAKKRGPEERAEMLARLGFKHFAYDYRAEHVPTFDAE